MKYFTNLKPCPFCGGNAIFERSSRGYLTGESCKVTYVRCSNCDARTAKFKLMDYNNNVAPEIVSHERTLTRQKAINSWNRRTNK